MAVLCKGEKGALVFGVKAIPGAKKPGVCGEHNGMLKIKLKSPPDKGRANEELAELIASLAGIRESAVKIVKGEHSREKTVALAGCSAGIIDKICGGKNVRTEKND